MSSISLNKKQCDLTWGNLPEEIRLLIFKALMQDGCTLARLATVSPEWQTELERYNFARIKLTPSRLVDFSSMIHRNRALVGYIWFCLELDTYDCTKCAPTEKYEEAFSISDTDNCPITTAFQILFSSLSTCDLNGDLILDISIYSPSESEHWFTYLTFMPDTLGGGGIEQMVSDKASHDPQHGWVAGFRHSAPSSTAIRKVFHSVMEEGPFDSEQLEIQWWDQLPSVPAVTSLLLRQQNRRRWKPDSLAHMFARFPDSRKSTTSLGGNGTFCRAIQIEVSIAVYLRKLLLALICIVTLLLIILIRYLGYRYLFESIRRFNSNLKRLVVFENFNQQYPTVMQQFQLGEDLSKCDTIRNPAPAVSRMIALASLKLEHLAASFIVDASHFFEIEPSWEWPNLTSLVLTSKALTPDENSIDIGAMLQAAAAATIKMPQLETMEIWNGRKGLAALFKYQAFRDIQEGIIIWRGTWKLTIEPSIIQAWEAVVHRYDGWRFNLVEERLDEAAIKSHGDAIHYLMLSSEVIRPISLQQIQIEQKALEGVKTV